MNVIVQLNYMVKKMSRPIPIPNTNYNSIDIEYTQLYKIEKKDKNGNTFLHNAIIFTQQNRELLIKKDLDLVMILIKNGANLHSPNYKLETPLHWLIEELPEYIETVLHYLSIRGNLLITYDQHDETILHKAVNKGNFEAVKQILLNKPEFANDFYHTDVWYNNDPISELITSYLEPI